LNKPKKLRFNLDPLSVKKYLYSYNSFVMIRHLLNANGFAKFYLKRENKINYDKKTQNIKMMEFKKKLNIHMYTNERFHKKFGIDILQFMGQIASKDENSEEYKKLMTKLKESAKECQGH
jgi:hypothetical protein